VDAALPENEKGTLGFVGAVAGAPNKDDPEVLPNSGCVPAAAGTGGGAAPKEKSGADVFGATDLNGDALPWFVDFDFDAVGAVGGCF